MGEPTSLNWLLNRIKDKSIDPKKIRDHERRVLVRYFLQEHMEMSHKQIADVCGTNSTWVTRFRQKVLQEDGWVVDQLDVRAYATHLIITTKWSCLALRRKGKIEQAQKLEFQLAETLMELGYLPKAPIQIKNATGMTLWDILMESQKAPKEIDGELIEQEKETHEGSGNNGVAKILNGSVKHSDETASD